MQCKIKKWDPSATKPGRIFLIVGRRGSGKSVLLRELMRINKDKVDFAMAFCPTLESRKMLLEHLPEGCVFDRLVQSKIDDLVTMGSKLTADGKKRRILLILDDVLYDKQAFKSKAIRELFYNGRHFHIQLIILSQFLMDIEPSLRANVDYCICFKDNIISNKMRLWKYMFGLLSSLEDFISVMDRCTQNYECLVLDNTGASSAISDSLFWYKANLIPEPFKVGSKAFFRLSEQMKRPEGSPVPMLVEGNATGAKAKARLHVIKEDVKAEESDDSDHESAR